MLRLTKHCKTQQKIRLFGIMNAMFLDKLGPDFPQGHRHRIQNDRENAKKVGGAPKYHLHHYEVHGRHKEHRRDGNKANQLEMIIF